MVEDQRALSVEQRDLLSDELRTAREWINGVAVPYKLITAENFPTIAAYAPDSLEMLKRTAEGAFGVDNERLDVRDNYHVAWTWPDEKERAFLIASISIGLYEDALNMLKEDYKKRIELNSLKDKKVGFIR